jgi:hypothetical protein
MMHKSTTFTTIFRVKKCYFHYDFACKKVPLSLRYAKKICLIVKNISLALRSLSSSEDATKDQIFKIFCHGTYSVLNLHL